MSAILQNIFYSKFKNLPASVQKSISSKQIQVIYKYMVDPCVDQAIGMYLGESADSLESDIHTKVIANLIVRDIAHKDKPPALFRSEIGIELVQPCRVDKYKRYKIEGNDNYIGMYTQGITPEQIMSDWGNDE